MNKNKFLLYLHLLCLLFFFIKEILLAEHLTPLSIFCFIIYLTMIILPAVFNSLAAKLIVHIALLPGMGYASIYIPAILLLLPLHITRILSLFSLSIIIEPVFYLPPVFFTTGENTLFYLLFSLIIYLVYRTLYGYDRRAEARERTIDRLESNNQYLSRKISRLEELDNEKELLIKLEERNRIAQKLHDELGHTITGSIVQLEAVNTIIRDEPEKAEKMIATISSVLNNGMNSIRQGLKSLKPESGQIGIQQVKQMLGGFEKNTGIRSHLKTGGSIFIISPDIWRIIVMNLKEALTNVLKHSRATDIFVEINVFNKIIKAGMKDNGQGMKNIRPGMGLTGIEERTKAVGGTLILDGLDGFAMIMLFKKGDEHANPGFNSR
ncbi:MAG: sensor histidine kinase [Spirochaetales bacterium]|nr:sensor histidine kinase [Spirochaetales bacterium]